MWLYNRIITQGTLLAPPDDPKSYVPNPLYARRSTVNWMGALSLIVTEKKIDSAFAQEFYKSVKKANLPNPAINTILEQLLFALHYCSGIRVLKEAPHKSDIARIATVAWYYGLYTAASAMIAAQEGTVHDNHAKTAKVWDEQIALRGHIPEPFSWRIATLVEKDAQSAQDDLRKQYACRPSDSAYSLARHRPPQSLDEAYKACLSGLSGTVNYFRWKTEEDIKSSIFKKLHVKDFRTKKAKELRDQHLSRKTVGFMHQAFRYRGKANYRDALFLAMGQETEDTLMGYLHDIEKVLDAFVSQAGIFCSRRLAQDIWTNFMHDIDEHKSFSLSPYSIWGSS